MEKKKPKKVTNGGPKNSPGKNNANGGADGTVPSILDEVKMLVSYKTRLDEEHLKPPRRASVGSISKPKLIGTTVSTSKSTIKLTGADSMSRSGSLDQLAETKMPMSKAKDQESLKLKLKGKKDYLCFDQTGVMTKKLVEQTVAREIQNANGSAAPVQVSSSTDEENQTDSDENTNNSGNNHNSDGIATWRPKAGTKTKVNVKNTVEQLAANLVYNLRHYNKGWFNKTASHYPEYFIEISSYERHARKAPPKEEKPEANDTPKKPASS